ncbi:MAG: hypothetical protein MUF42_14045 [Cytophagaceae bacterium]|jgi:hypothetical protein|nr:hypothetical protein [Cytophagaceae bacterium]
MKHLIRSIALVAILTFQVGFTFATRPEVEEFELQIMSGPSEVVQKGMKKFSSSYPDIEVSMHALGSAYGLRVGGCQEKTKVEALKSKLSKDYPGATIEPCN